MKELLKKFVKRECSPNEIQQIVSYFRSSKDLSDVPTIEDISKILESYPDMDQTVANRIYKNILDAAQGEKAPNKRKSNTWKYAAAAIFIGMLATSYFLKNNGGGIPEADPPIRTNTNTISIGTDKATLTLEDGAVIALEKDKVYQTNNISGNGKELVYTKAGDDSKAKTVYHYLTIPNGGQYYVKLSDGTEVWLNSESKLKYPKVFEEGKAREVELVYGEAYFDVSPSTLNKGSKFKVLNQNQEVEVLGTEFNIKAYKDEDNIYTTLVEGKVTVSNAFANENLMSGQQSKINLKNKNITINAVDVYGETSWRKGLFSFKGKPLREIMIVLARWYNFKVEFANAELEKVKFNGVLSKNDSIEEILTAIKNTKFINAYEITEDTITIK